MCCTYAIAGAGVAALLAMHYRARYPGTRVAAWCFAPPGGLMSPGAAASLEGTCFAVVSAKVSACVILCVALQGRALCSSMRRAAASLEGESYYRSDICDKRNRFSAPPVLPPPTHTHQLHATTQDMIPRMSLWTVERLRDEIMMAALRCKVWFLFIYPGLTRV